MKRNINIINNQIQNPISGFDAISLNNIDSIVDCSVDNILYFCIEQLDKNAAKTVFDSLVKKLRPKGSLAVKFCDLKQLCADYSNNIISNLDLINKIQLIKNPLSTDEIITYVNINNTKVINISRDKNDIVITITRTAL